MKDQLHIGSHISSAGGYLAMGKEAAELNADVFAFFTRNPRGGKAKDIDPKDVEAFLAFSKKNHIGPLVAHAPYTMNPCAAKDNLRQFAREMMADDLRRLEETPQAVSSPAPVHFALQQHSADAQEDTLRHACRKVILNHIPVIQSRKKKDRRQIFGKER